MSGMGRRERDGKRIFRLECEHDTLVLALIESQRISECEALDHSKIEIAAAQVLDDFAKRFLAGIR